MLTSLLSIIKSLICGVVKAVSPMTQALILNLYSAGVYPSATSIEYLPLLTIPEMVGEGNSSMSIGPI